MEYLVILFSILTGILFGIITGLTPGIHINLIAAIIITSSYEILKILDPITIVITITSMTITHTILDIIPSTLLGIPNAENLTMLLPAHKLTIEGNAKTAINYGLLGSALGIIITIAFSPLTIIIIPIIYNKIKEYIGYILIIIFNLTLYILKSKNKLISLAFFLITGIVGIISFNIKTIDQPLLPMLSGLFGLSALILSIKNKIIIPEQKEANLEVSKKDIIKYSITTTLSSTLTNFLPGLTSSYTALISNKISKVKNQEHYIILSNAANSSAIIISFIALYTINKARSGAVATIQYLINSINMSTLILIISISLITLSVVTIFAKILSNKIIKNINKINYQKTSIFIIILIILIVLIITRFEGLIILIVTTSIGIIVEKLKVEKITLTGCLVVPVIIYYLIFQLIYLFFRYQVQ